MWASSINSTRIWFIIDLIRLWWLFQELKRYENYSIDLVGLNWFSNRFNVVAQHLRLEIFFTSRKIVHRLFMLELLIVVIAFRHFVALQPLMVEIGLRWIRQNFQRLLPLRLHNRMEIFGDIVSSNLILAEFRFKCFNRTRCIQQLNFVEFKFLWTFPVNEIDFFFVSKITLNQNCTRWVNTIKLTS